jgi:hypothetical protein
MTKEEYLAIIDECSKTVDEQIRHHYKCRSLDGTLYNSNTIVLLLCTSLVSCLPSSTEGWLYWLPKALAVASTFLIALDRALGFGPRWRFHIELENLYRTLNDQLLTIRTVETGDFESRLRDFRTTLAGVRARERGIPGAGSTEA